MTDRRDGVSDGGASVVSDRIRPRSTGLFSRALIGIVVAMIRSYQGLIRPLLIGSCKFCPSCSEYAIEALRVHGFRRGSALSLRRVGRCHPFGAGGIDPVPSADSSA